jgi:hypothetical protein
MSGQEEAALDLRSGLTQLGHWLRRCWSCELLSPKGCELDPWKTAPDLKSFLEHLLV